MIVRLFVAACLLLCFIPLSAVGQAPQKEGVQSSPIEVSFCDLVAQSANYLGVDVAVRVRLTYLKEGTSIWDPNCPNLSAVLMAKSSDEADHSINELYARLKTVGLSSHPVTAILTGKLKTERSHSSRSNTVLEFFANRAADISQTKRAERRHFEPR